MQGKEKTNSFLRCHCSMFQKLYILLLSVVKVERVKETKNVKNDRHHFVVGGQSQRF